MSAALSFGHGANDAQKAMGVIAALLLASGHLDTLSVPLWVKLACGAALTLGTAMGGWRIIRTIGRRIFRLAPIDGFASQSASTAVILPASYLGAPVSTTQVVASSVVGVGGGRRRWHHVRWTRRALDRLRLAADASGLGRARGDNAVDLEGDSDERAGTGSCPQAPDVLGMLSEQAAITVEGMDELVAWANGDAGGGRSAAPARARGRRAASASCARR